jgi:hypothetical protein
MHTYTNLFVEELDVLDGLVEHRSGIRLHTEMDCKLIINLFWQRVKKGDLIWNMESEVSYSTSRSNAYAYIVRV